MKFIVAVVMLALACSTQAGVLTPLGYSSLGYPSLGYSSLGVSQLGLPLTAPWGINPYAVPIGARLLAPEGLSLNHGIPSAISLNQGIPLTHGYALPAARIATPIIAAPVEGSYVAANRGAVHVAPLPGHLQSASSVNLEPAPGTF